MDYLDFVFLNKTCYNIAINKRKTMNQDQIIKPIKDYAYSPYRQTFLTRVFNWMTVAIVISGISAYLVLNNESAFRLIYGGHNFYILLGIELILAISLSAAIKKLNMTMASIMFVVYSILSGLTLSGILILFQVSSILQIFITTAVIFAVAALYGVKSKSNLNSLGRYLLMALIGVIVVSILNTFFFKSSGLDWVMSLLSVGIFTGLTAYDTQKMIKLADSVENTPNADKMAIVGALELYLDFINLFISLLRLFGEKK